VPQGRRRRKSRITRKRKRKRKNTTRTVFAVDLPIYFRAVSGTL
jgi:hypothetical protein